MPDHTANGPRPDELRVFDQLPDHYLVLSPELIILGASDAYLNLTGKDREAITGGYLFDVFPLDPPWLPGEDGGMAQSLAEVIRTKEQHNIPQLRFDIPDGSGKLQERYWKSLNKPILDEAGRLRYIIHRTEEVTEQVAKEKALAVSLRKAELLSQQMERLFHDIPAQIAIVLGPDLVYNYVNPQYNRELFPGREVIGLPLLTALPEVAGQPIWHILQGVYRSGIAYIQDELHIPLAAYNGGPLTDHYFNTVYQPLFDETGKVYGILSFKYEVTAHVTARKKLETSEERLREANTALSATVEEMQAIQEELAASNEELITGNEELSRTRDDLKEVNTSLEERVHQRTQELAASVEEQQAINEELNATNDELRLTQERLDLSLDKLLNSEQRFRNLIRGADVGIILLMGAEMRIEIVNDAYGRLIERSAAELDGKLLFEVIPDAENTYRPLLEAVLRTGEPVYLYDAPYLVYKDDKPVSGFLNVIYQAYRETGGRVTGVLALVQDVSEQVKARQALEMAEKAADTERAKLAAIITSSNDAIISKTLESVITSWNNAAQRMFGYSAEEIIGQTIYTLIPPGREQEEPLILARLKKGERVEHFETQRKNKDGHLIDVSLTISPIKDAAGQIIGISNIARDITEKKREEQRKNDFIGMVSHELKTPLTSLSAILQVSHQKLKKADDIFLSSAMAKASVQVKRMSGMISGFLNVSRLEASEIHIDKRWFDLNELISSVIEEVTLTVGSHALVFEACPAVKVFADSDKINSVITNLVSNAIKYSPKGKTVWISCLADTDKVTVSIRDEGMGIKPGDQEKIFGRYYRVESQHTRHISGFGIGLYLSAEIIRRHGGEIWVESESGVGSTFSFSLPLAQ